MTNEAYIIAREAIKRVLANRANFYDEADAPHYLALGVLAALEEAGYAIEKKPVDA